MVAGVTALVLCLLVLAVPANAVVHTVGDSDGWAGGVDYEAWASGKTFVVGDALLFQYGYPLHTVTEVSASDYDGCSDAGAIRTYTDQNTKIALTRPGTRYFICATPGHCFGGMKLSVTVSAAGDGTTTYHHPPESPALSAPSSPSILSEGPSKEIPAGKPSSSSSPPAVKSPPVAAATSEAAAMAGGSVERKALLSTVVFLLGSGLMD